jgi:hypothetical protein
VIELARSGTKVAALVEVCGVSEASIYNWLKQDRIDRGELEDLSTDQANCSTAALDHPRRTRDRDPRLHRTVPQHPASTLNSGLAMRTPAEVEAEWLRLVDQRDQAKTAWEADQARPLAAGLSARRSR